MNIHAIVYIIIGCAVSIIAYNIDYSKLILFFWVGILFILIGLVKFMFIFLKKELKPNSKKNEIHSHHHKHNQQPKINYPQNNLNPQTQKNCNNNITNNNHIFCHNCGAKVSPNFHFCPGCGSKLK